MAGFLADKGLLILRNGYNVIPIKAGQKFPTIPGWQKIETKPPDVQRWLRNGHADAGVGITTGRVSFVDIDIYDRSLVVEIVNWIEANIGFAPIRVGNAPKCGLLFRAETPFRKITSRVFVDEKGREVRVEILGVGQQFVSHHIHPDTDKPYLWSKNDGPEFVPVADLPPITEAQARAIVTEFERIAATRNWTSKSQSETGSTMPPADDDELDFGTDPIELTDDELRDLLMSIPNDGTFDDRFDWFRIGCCVKHQASDPDAAREMFHDWSVQHHKHNEGLFNKAWKSIGNYSGKPLTARYLLKVAKIVKEKNDTRPAIRVKAGELPKLATEAESALIAFGAPLYTRGQRIVRPIVETVDASKSRRTKVSRLTEVSVDSLVDWMARAAKWQKFNVRAKSAIETDPPRQVAAILASRDGEWRLKPLTGVITTPTLRPDGSLLIEPGYDPTTRLLLVQPPPLPDIPAHPSKRDAERALRLLGDLINEFPFVDEPSRAVALSGLISPVVRGALSVVPLHVMSAPAAGSGKSYIVDLVSAIATGRACPVIAAGRNEEETEKRLGAVLIAGQTIVSIDNLNGDLNGDFLCQAVERPRVQVRKLGESQQIQIESRASIFATGNNIAIRGDMIRRSLLCSLDPNLERPELREFKRNPFDTILANRGDYIAAALTITRAYIEAGRPVKLSPLASFDDWSDLVRSSLVWLGTADPVITIERSRSEDPDIAVARQFVAAWARAIGDRKPKLISELITAADPTFDTDHGFSEAVSNLAGGGIVTAKTLAYWLRRHRDRVVGDYKIRSTVKSEHGVKWWLEEIDPL